MAIIINTTLTKGGLTIGTGSMIKPNTHFPKDVLGVDDNGDWDGTKMRKVTMDLVLYSSKDAFQSLETPIGPVDQFPGGFTKFMDDSDWNSLSGTASALLTVEGWLKDWLEEPSRLGTGSCTIIDPYSV